MNYGNWRLEVIGLLNEKNGTQFKETDLILTQLETSEDEITSVRVEPAPGVAYYNERVITYTKRRLDNSVLGIPIRMVVNDNVTMRNLLHMFAEKYGYTFDEMLDFTQDELDRVVDFSVGGIQVVDIQSAETSMVWVGALPLTVANDALDLSSIIKVADLENLQYVSLDPEKAFVRFATLSTDWNKADPRLVERMMDMRIGEAIARGNADEMVETMLGQGVITEDDGLSDVLPTSVLISREKPDDLSTYVFSDVSHNPSWAGGPAMVYDDENVPRSLVYVLGERRGNAPHVRLKGTWDGPENRYATITGIEGKIPFDGNTDIEIPLPDAKEGDVIEITFSKGLCIELAQIKEVISWVGATQVSFVDSHIERLPAKLDTFIRWMNDMFGYCTLGPEVDITQWNTGKVTSMIRTFLVQIDFNQDISGWDVSNVVDFTSCFEGAIKFNQPIGKWDMRKAYSVERMFYDAREFNQDLSSWRLSDCRIFTSMFQLAVKFTSDLSQWDMRKATKTNNMFHSALVFESDLNNWIMSSVTTIGYMFYWAKKFNSNLDKWDTSNVATFTSCFEGADLFNGKIGTWSFAKVFAMNSMLRDAKSFNQPIGAWVLTKATALSQLLSGAISFNQPIGDWDVSNVTSLAGILEGAIAFAQDISKWNVSKVTNMQSMIAKTVNFKGGIGVWVTTSLETMTSFAKGAKGFEDDLADWDVSNVVNMNGAFMDTDYTGKLGTWKPTKLTDMGYFIANNAVFDEDLSGWDVSTVTNRSGYDQGTTAWKAEHKPVFAA